MKDVLERARRGGLGSLAESNDSSATPVWVMWWQGVDQAPEIVRTCIDSIVKNMVGHQVHLLDSSNYQDFVIIDSELVSKYEAGTIGRAHFSDIVRVSLLRQHGGIWIDATMLVTRPLELEAGASGFVSRKTSPAPDGRYVSDQRWALYFLGGPRTLQVWDFLDAFLAAYWKRHSRVVDYFLTDHALDIAYRHDLCGFRAQSESLAPSQPDLHLPSTLLRDGIADVEPTLRSSTTSLFKLSWRLERDLGPERYRALLLQMRNVLDDPGTDYSGTTTA